ncbi:Sigma factor regulator N-terminal [Lysinibacillus sp. AC-3]|uniref:anti-sigma factor n=1 Tax=unclassified Lysinibacillus TaxID=2636778 RepID=UPI0009C5DD52|nr:MULTISPECIES: anti-sigma factor [unclassified Lysinibacillus]SKC07241.1 Sigma factor regulator N-terminal [Lysinibacillus sp. AC-3]
MTEWSQGNEKKILRKYRFTLTFRVLRILLICFIIYTLYIAGLSIVFEKTRPDLKHAYNSLIVLEWQHPNIKGQYSKGLPAEITPFLTQKMSYPLEKQVGKEKVVVGEMRVEKSILNSNSSMSMNLTSINTSQQFNFNLPEDPVTGKATSSHLNNNVWKALEKLPEGAVAEMAFSTSTFKEPKELEKMLAPYDVRIVWMPLYTGEFKSFEPTSSDRISGTITINDRIGLSGGLTVSDDYSHISEAQDFTSLRDSQRWMLKNMEKLLAEKESYYEGFLGLHHLQERYDYIKKNGFQAYGAVVTGPTKRLLMLRDLEGISNEMLGDVELMNGYNW